MPGTGASGYGDVAGKKARARAAFRRLDTDGSGFLDKEEFVTALAILAVPIDRAGALEVFSIVDSDSNGRLSEAEFVRCVPVGSADGQVGRIDGQTGGGDGDGGGGGGASGCGSKDVRGHPWRSAAHTGRRRGLPFGAPYVLPTARAAASAHRAIICGGPGSRVVY